MSSKSAIRVQDLSKCYEIYAQPQDRLKQSIHPRLQRLLGRQPRTYYREFWALKDVSFEVDKGEAVGIIGRNGAGKSTLLQLVCGTLNPTCGSVEVEGTVSALLELGSGFNPEFTGRENVFVNAQILGLSREETLSRFDEIASFADIGEFMDQPVKIYSSGMMMRLAFAVQTAVDPTILIVDEALSVGDMFFQAKCMARINKLVDSGVALLFVSHDVGVVTQLCRRAILLQDGRVSAIGMAKSVVDEYMKLELEERNLASRALLQSRNTGKPELRTTETDEDFIRLNMQEDSITTAVDVSSCSSVSRLTQTAGGVLPSLSDLSFGRESFSVKAQHARVCSGDAEIINVQMLKNSAHSVAFDFDDIAEIRVVVNCYRDLGNLDVALKICTLQGSNILFFDTRLQGEMARKYKGGKIYLFDWHIKLPLMHGNYLVACGLAHPPSSPGQDWIFVDMVPHAYDFKMSPRQFGMIDGFVTLPAQLIVDEVGGTVR